LGDAKQANVILSVCCGTLFAACVVQGAVIALYRRFFALLRMTRSTQSDGCRCDASATMAATGRRYIGNLL